MLKTLQFNEVRRQLPYRLSRRDGQDIERACARLFSSEDDKAVLGWLQHHAFDRHYAAETPHGVLRYQDGQRALVALLMRTIARGKGE